MTPTSALFQNSLLVSLLHEFLILKQLLLQGLLSSSVKFSVERREVFPVLLEVGEPGLGFVIVRGVIVDHP